MAITLEDFQKCCRCCLSTAPPFHPLFGLHLSEMLNDIASINVYLNDGYPQQVCRRCVSKIGTASTFKKMVLKNHQIFTELIKESSVNKVTDDTDIDHSDMFTKDTKVEIEVLSTDYEIQRVKENAGDKMKSYSTAEEKHVGSSMLKPEDKEQNVNLNVSKGTINVKEEIIEISVLKVEEINEEDYVESNEDQESEEGFKRGEDSSITSSLSSCQDPVQTPTFKCPFCPIRCENITVMKLHLSTHNEICTVCGKTISRWNKTRHMRTHAEKTLRCEQCGKEFSDRSYYREHLKKHTNEPSAARKDCLCCYCGRKYKWKTSLYRHLHIHVGNSHDCEFCDKKFTNPCYLKMHLAQHTSRDRKPFACDQCDAKFTRNYTLAQHKRDVHTSTGRRAKYPCSNCAKKFLNKCSLRRHETLKHLTEPKIYECSDCGKQFNSRRSIALHLRVHKTTPKLEQENTLLSTENMEPLKLDIEKITVVKVEEYAVNSYVFHL